MLLFGAEPHHRLNPGAIVPTAVEDDHLAGRGKMRHVALYVHLRLLALSRRRQCHDPEHPRADPFGDRLDGATLASRITALEHDHNALPGHLHPFLQGAQLSLQFAQLFFVDLALELTLDLALALLVAAFSALPAMFVFHDRYLLSRPRSGNRA